MMEKFIIDKSCPKKAASLTFTTTTDVHDRIRILAKQNDIAINGLVEQMVKFALKNM